MKKVSRKLVSFVLLLVAPAVWSTEQIGLTAPLELSTQLPDYDGAYKTKIEGLDNGVLVVVYGDFVENDPQKYVFDNKDNALRPARDVFITTCNSTTSDCSIASGWSVPINLSNTAMLSSIQTDWKAEGVRTDYHGDSDNPHIFSSGNHVVVSWADKYCPGGQQRSVTYLEFGSREIPMSCVYVAHATSNADQLSDWTIDRLTDGSRDVKQDNTKGLSSGVWAVTWQEDPLGLQPGEAEGPGEGSSGAKVSHGTDIWYTYTSNVASAVSDIGVWKAPVRITDNQTGYGLSGSFNPIKNSAGNAVDPNLIEKGSTGSSRANLQIVGGSSPPNTVIAYEETKGSAGLDEGKFLRYHVFPYNNPPSTALEKAGCIVSDPAENARRARFVAQTNAASGSGIRFAIFWRQGVYDQGGPADIMLRIGYLSADPGSTGLNPADLYPPIDPNCFALDYDAGINLDNDPPLNISSNTNNAVAANLSDATSANFLENARAHRAVLRANDLYLGYIYAEDGVVADATDLANYNFFVRRFNAANATWGSPVNLSNITNTAINVLEPRLMGTPGNQPGCTDPNNVTNPQNCQNKNVVIAAWGTETNVYEHVGGSENLDVYITRTTDKGAHWSPLSLLASGPNAQGESQLRVTPDGNLVFAVWNETSGSATNSLFSLGAPITLSSDLAVSVSSAPVTVHAGSPIDIAYHVENIGPDTAYDTSLVIGLPASVAYISSSAGCVYAGGEITCLLGDLNPGASNAVEIAVQSTAAESLTFSAVIDAYDLVDPVSNNNQVQSLVNATMASDVSVVVTSGTASVDVGGQVDVTYTVSNAGPSQADGATLTLPLPAGVGYISAEPAVCSEVAGTVSCDIGALGSNAATDVVVRYQVDVSGQSALSATASATQFDPVAGNNQAEIQITGVPHADVNVSATATRNKLKEGSHTQINMEVTNAGPQNASNVVLAISVPAGWEQRSLANSQGSCRIAGSSFICELGSLAVGSSAVIRLVGTVGDVATVVFHASSSADEGDPDLTNNESAVSIRFTADNPYVQQFFGCSLVGLNPSKTMFDPTLPLILLIALYKVGRKRHS